MKTKKQSKNVRAATATDRSPRSDSALCQQQPDASFANMSSNSYDKSVSVAALKRILQEAIDKYVDCQDASLRRHMLFIIWRKGVHVLLTADGCKCSTPDCFLRKSEASQEALLADSPVSFKKFLKIFERTNRKERTSTKKR